MQQLKEKFEETEVLSSDYQAAVNLDSKIKAHVATVQKSLYEVCKGLKEMRDGKLYKQLDYTSFEEYCENEVGLKRNQAYKYISIAENLSEDFVSSGIQNFGVTKLSLLAMLDEPTRDELTQRVDIQAISKRDLEKEIKELKAEHQQELDKLKETHQDEVTELEKQIKELEERPVDVMHSVEDERKIAELDRENESLRQQLIEAQAETDNIINDSADQTEQMELLQRQNEDLKQQIFHDHSEWGKKLREQQVEFEDKEWKLIREKADLEQKIKQLEKGGFDEASAKEIERLKNMNRIKHQQTNYAQRRFYLTTKLELVLSAYTAMEKFKNFCAENSCGTAEENTTVDFTMAQLLAMKEKLDGYIEELNEDEADAEEEAKQWSSKK